MNSYFENANSLLPDLKPKRYLLIHEFEKEEISLNTWREKGETSDNS
jgi:hypothetical protein